MGNIKYSKEWIEQAKYDIGAAEIMLRAGRNIYCIFMCHLCLGKAFKAIYVKKLGESPPKVHSLVYFAQRLNLSLPQGLKEFVESLDEVSVPVRYPEELKEGIKRLR